MRKRIMIQILRICAYIILAGIAIAGLSRIYILAATRNYIKSESDATPKPAAIVFGAGLRRDGTPTAILRDRVETAVRLYQAGIVQKILMSGDNRFDDYNEPGSMMNYAVSLGVPEIDIVMDFAGRRTYDTCYRAKEIFGLDSAILVTQEFHLPRAVYTCRNIDMDVEGIRAEGRTYRRLSQAFWDLREIPATLVSLWENHISRPTPVLGDPEPIFPDN